MKVIRWGVWVVMAGVLALASPAFGGNPGATDMVLSECSGHCMSEPAIVKATADPDSRTSMAVDKAKWDGGGPAVPKARVGE